MRYAGSRNCLGVLLPRRQFSVLGSSCNAVGVGRTCAIAGPLGQPASYQIDFPLAPAAFQKRSTVAVWCFVPVICNWTSASCIPRRRFRPDRRRHVRARVRDRSARRANDRRRVQAGPQDRPRGRVCARRACQDRLSHDAPGGISCAFWRCCLRAQ